MSNANTGAAPAGAAPAGYYTRPDLWKDAQKHQDDVQAGYLRLKHLEGGLQTQAKDIEDMTNALNYLQDRWQRAATVWDTATMEAVKLQYDDLQKQMRMARLAYAKSYGEYDQAYQGYASSWNAQNDYVTSQKEAEKQWRSTIRDPETVRSELAAIEGQIAAQRETDRAKRQAEYEAAQKAKPWYEKLAGYLGEAQDTTLPTYTNQGANVGGNSLELQALLEQQKLLQEEYEWAMYLPYADLMQNADFAEKSQYKSTYRGGEQFNAMTGTYSDTGFDDITYDYINRNETAINRQGLSDLQSNAALLGLDSSELRQMSDDEIAIFNYLYNPQDPAAAYEYITYLTSDLNARQRAAQEQQWAEYAKERPGAASAFSVMMSPMKGLSYLGQAADYFADGKMDQNAGYNKFSYIPGAIREQVAEDIKASAKTEFWGGVGSFGYQTAMSMADFLTTTLVSGGNSTLAMAIMGSGAAADTVIDAKDRGLNDNQAFALGTIAGVAEAVTEKFSLDTLLDKTSLGKSAAGYIFKNVLAEGSEEVASSLINAMADILISQDKSQWQLAIDAYMADGKTEGQAFGLALADQALALGLDFLGGALSGGVMAGGNVVINKGATAIANRGRKGTQPAPQEAADMPTVAQPASFQEENQRQVAENMGVRKTAQGATAQLAAPTVQVTDAQWQQGQRLAQLTGRNIQFYEGKASENGFFDPKTGEIWVNAKGGDPLAQVFSHELTHSIEQAGAYAKLSSLVLNRMQDAGMDLDTAREAKRQQYQRQGRPLPTQAAVDQELVAEYVSKHLLTNEQQIVSLVQQDRSLGQKIHDFFDRLLAKLGNKNAQERAFLSRAKNIYAKALRQTQNVGMGAAGTVQTEAAQPTGESDADVAGDDFLDNLDAQLAAGEITEEEYDGIREEYERWQEEQYTAGERKYSVGEIEQAQSTVDTGRALDYDNTVNETKGGEVGNEGREETRGDFHRRAIRKGCTVKERGQTAYAFRRHISGDISESAGIVERNLREKGIPVIVCDLFEANRDGVTIPRKETSTVAGEAVYVMNGITIDPVESANHEAFHFWKFDEARTLYVDTLLDNIDFSSKAAADFLGKIEQGYLGETIDVDDDRTNIVLEEAMAYLTGFAQSGDLQNIAHEVLRDYDAVKAAWDTLVETQTQKVAAAEGKAGVRGSSNSNIRYSLASDVAEDSAGRKLAAGQIAYFRDSKARDASGRLLVLFHQTGEVFTVFDMLRQGAGTNDSGTPFGVFLKSSSADIGLRGKHQMELYANITNPIYAIDRADLKKQIEQLSPEYAAIASELSELDAVYSAKVEDAKSDLQRFMEEWRKANPDASRRALYDVPEFNTLFDAEDVIVDEWTAKADELSKRAKKVLTQALRNAGYDGVILKNDTGSFGRNTDAYIALDPAQVKNVDNLEPTANPDLRYSLAEVEDNGAADETKPDAGYLDAVNRGDMDVAQKMVDEDAKVAGYTIKAYHGTSSEFTTFQRGHKRTRGSLNFGSGFYFSPKRSFAENYTTTGRVIEGFLKLEKPYEVFGTRFDRSDLEAIAKKAGKEVTIENVAQILQQMGYDGIIAKDYNGTTNPVNQYVIFDANQVKSADPVTYDDKGKVIPLSERFNSGSNDIRYSLADEAENVSEEKLEADAPEAKPDLRSSMPRKAAEMLKRTERELLWAIADRLSVPKLAGREYLTPIIQEMADEYLEKGSISPETRQLLFEKAYAQAVIVDAEFYEQYKHIKDHLRTTPVTISDRDKLDIADFNDFRKRAFGSLKIVNEGGLPVDAAYQELQSMAPELFPESITHPADQLVRMFDASRSIQVTEKTVQDYFGKYEPEYRKGAQSAFEEAIAEATGKLWEVKRFAEEKIAKEKESAPATEQEAMEAYQKLKKARRELDKVNAKNLLTESDQMQVGRLLRHEILPEDLKAGKDNVKGILAVFQAKQEYEHLCKLVAEYKRHLRGKARAEADELLKTANSWKDKRVGIAYSRETMERNVMDIIEDKALAQRVIDKYFAPVHTAEAASTRFKQDYRDRVRSMNISRKVQKGNLVSEAYAVQLLGEAQDNLQMLENARGRIKQRDGKNRHEWQAVIDALWAENPLLDRGKIEKAVKDFRYIYDALFQKMNQVRVANGYEPVNYRQGYFPHFQAAESDSVLAQFGRALGIDTRIDALPTTINGMTHAFKPGIQWFGNAQERLGFETAYDAVEGFDKYIEGVANVIHHTQNIQNLRAFASQIRYRTSDEGIRNQVDEIYQRQGLTDEEKQQLITEIYTHGKFTLSGFVAELDEYTNLLAGKKSRYDRAIEAAMGRKAYSVLKAWESRVAANMIAGNLTSALTNFIPWTQAGAQVGYMRLLRGVANTLQSTRSDDGFAGASTFLTNRRGVDPLVQTWAQKASGIASKPMELIDSLVSESIVRAAYEQNRQQGLSEAEAMAQADAFAAGVMADRSKGATPTLFHSTNPLMKAFTQFQLEVNNQFSEVFKDIPRRYRDKKLRELVWVLLKYFLGAWLYNWLYEKLIGRRPALDPIGMLCQFGEDWKEDGLGTAGANLASDALGQLPFASGLTLIGVETDGGRLPASSAVMDLTAIWKAATTEGWSAKKRWKEVQDELNKLAYVVPPFGGNQVGKLYKGLKAYFQGGSYSVDVAGNEVLQYPVYKDNPGDAFASFVKATILGKSSLGTAQEWVDKGFNSLGAKQTAAYQDMLEAGVSDREAYELIRQISDAKETDAVKKAAVQRDVLRQSQVSGDGKAIAYYGLMASEKEWAIMDWLADMGADAGAVANALMDMADMRAKDGSKQADVLAVISKAVLTDEEKAVLVGSVIGTEMLTEEGNLTQYAKFDYAVQNGMGVDQYIQYRASGASIDDYLVLRDAGATVEDAMEAAMALQELKDSVEDPTTVQKWKAVMAGVSDPERQMISLSVVMSDSQYAKLTTARGFGVSPADFVSANEKIAKYDRDGNGRLTQAEVTHGISNLRLTMQQKAVLWQLITGSSSAKNNPYSQAIGERVIAALEKAKAEGKKPGHSFQDEIMRQIMANMEK